MQGSQKRIKNKVALIQFIGVGLLSVGCIKIINNMYFLLILGLLVFTCQESIRQKMATPVQGGDLSFLRALNNYYGCKTWDETECIECSPGYFFNDNKICSKITDQCKNFNRAVGICQECYLGYSVYSGQCILEGLAKFLDLGCKRFQESRCVQCSVRYYFDDQGRCQPVSDLCRKWDNKTGQCTDCYQGYYIVEGQCQQMKLPSFGTLDAFCAKWSGRTCLHCAERAYFGPIGLCIPVSDYCRTWDNFDGFCLTCYAGYDLMEGRCEESEKNLAPPPDMGCKTWDWQNQICLQCSERWVFNTEDICVPVSDNCRMHSSYGNCVDCYKGYDLIEGVCEFSASNLQGPTDLGCKIWNWQQLKCLECAERWTFNDDNLCIPVSNECKYFNRNTGQCTGCYLGYYVEDGGCRLSEANLMRPVDPGCKIWDWEEQVCTECSFRWVFLKNGTCKKVSQKCQTFGTQAQCLTCYKGYQIKNGQCVESEKDYCEIKGENGICKQCYLGYTLKDNKCVIGNPLCKDVDEEGNCTSCFKTYALYKNICVPLVKLVNLAQYYASCCPDLLKIIEGRQNGLSLVV